MGRNSSRLPLLLFALLSVWIMSRLAPWSGEPPAFFVSPQAALQVELSGGWSRVGIYQLFDDIPPGCVNELTARECALLKGLKKQGVNGSVQELDETGDVGFGGWVPARQRMALQIPLHPDRMTEADWPALPGIGAYLAVAIEEDRQKNGDFVMVSALQRVKGVGKKRLAALRPYFY